MTDHYEPRTEELPSTPTVVIRLLLKLMNAIMDKRVAPSRFTRKISMRRENGKIIETSIFTIEVEAEIGKVE